MPSVSFAVSALPDSWFDAELIPWVRAATGGDVLWLVADHGDEIDLLFERLRISWRQLNRPCREVLVHASDPGLVWSELYGGIDSVGLIHSCETGSIVVLRGSATLAEGVVERLARPLRGFAMERETIVIGGSTSALVNGRPTMLVELGFKSMTVKPFRECSLADRYAIATELLEAASARSELEFGDGFAREVIDTGRPESRTELEDWVRYYSLVRQTELLLVPPDIPRAVPFPRQPMTRVTIRAQFDTLRTATHRMNRKYAAWLGRELFGDVREFRHPIDAGAPDGWFSSTVSYLACLLFDASDEGIAVIRGLAVGSDGELSAVAPPPFFDTVRALRTRFQHALSYASAHDRSTFATAAEWFRRAGVMRVESPGEHEWRGVTEHLLSEWSRAWLQLDQCLDALPASRYRRQIEAQIDARRGELKRWQWVEIAQEAIAMYGFSLDPKRVVEKRVERMQRELREALVRPEEVRGYAVKIAEKVVCELAQEPPVDVSDLMAAGLVGPQLGRGRAIAQEAFLRRPAIDRAELLALVLAQLLPSDNGDGS